MKRTIKSIAAVMVVLTLCLAMLTACGGVDSPIIGKWTMVSASAMGIEMSASEMGIEAYVEFFPDGTCVLTEDGESSARCPFTDNGDGTYTSDGQLMILRSDGKLEVTAGGATMVFAK